MLSLFLSLVTAARSNAYSQRVALTANDVQHAGFCSARSVISIQAEMELNDVSACDIFDL